MIIKLATSPSIKPSHKGRLHEALGIPEGEPIPVSKLEEAKNSQNPHMRQMANYALMAKSRWHHK